MTVQAGVDGIGIAAGARAGAIRESGYSQADTVAARLERLPMTSYQRGIFLIIATAWFFDSMDLGTLTFVLGSIRSGIRPVERAGGPAVEHELPRHVLGASPPACWPTATAASRSSRSA